MELKDKRVVVVGLARSGIAAARLLTERGAHVVGNDRKDDPTLASQLDSLGAQAVLGDHPVSILHATDLVVVSPGVPATLPLLAAAVERDIEVLGELELAWRLRDPQTRYIAITGSNGKSTTVTLTAHLLQAAGVKTWVGGNLGTPLSTLISSGEVPEWAVVEVSSFQLEWAPTFRPQIAAILNVSANHLDRHASFDEYAQLKARIWGHQTGDDIAVYNRDDEHSRALSSSAGARTISFGSSELPDDGGARFDDESATIQLNGRSSSYSLTDLPAPGAHNRANAAAALLMARLAGADASALAPALATFQPLPHRLELVAEIDGVRYFNDSKATTVTALGRSLDCFDSGVVLIAGGKDKGGDFTQLVGSIRSRVKEAILIGEASDKIESAWTGATAIYRSTTLEDAFTRARSIAEASDVVLFSPACASFDMFENFEARGDAFRTLAQQASGEAA